MKKISRKIHYVLFFPLFLLVNCNREMYENEELGQSSNIKRSKVNLEEFKLNREAYLVYEKLKSNKNNTKNSNINSFDFEINFDDGIHLNYANLESYTFPIKKLFGNGLLENLVISKHTDGKYYAKILKYDLTSQEINDLKSNSLKSIQNPIQTEVLGEVSFGNTVQNETCYQTVQVITSCGSGEHHAGNISSWINCTATTLPSIKTVTIAADCGGSTGGGGGFNYGYGDGTSGYYGNPFSSGGGGGYFTPIFPTNSTPIDLYENGISEPVLDTGYQNQPVDTFYNNLNYNQQQWLNSQDYETQLEILNYLVENNFSNESKENVQNLIDVNLELAQNENIILEIPCDQIQYWQTISQHQVPDIVKQKIKNIDDQTGWFTSANIQNLDHPNNGAVVNMDFFPVTISQMPKKSNGVAYTQKELFDYIRLHINDFFDDLVFTPVVDSDYNLNEVPIWNSTNPLGAILSININPDEGSVVCSKYNSTTGEWYFTTVEVPWDGTHPVSGHRAFGYYTDINGKMVIYTRGVDRYSFGTHMLGNTGATLEATSQLAAFAAADSKWQNFQQKIANFVNQGQGNGFNGVSNTNTPEKYRPDWNKVKNVLNGTLPKSSLGCN